MASAFEELGVAPELIRAVEELGWTLPTPVQAEAIPLILGGGDVMAAAETGSGKTGAFALPVIQIVHETLRALARGAAMVAAAASAAGAGAAAAAAAGAASAAAAGGGGGGGGGYGGGRRRVELSLEDRDAALSVRDGVACQCRDERAWGGARATLGAFAGRAYYEAEVMDDGLCRVGWSAAAATLDLGTDRHSFGYGGTGKKSHARAFDAYGGAFGRGDVIGCMLDADAGELRFSRNGADLGAAFALPQYLKGRPLYPAVCLKNAELRLNFGGPGEATPLRFGPPEGYVALGDAPAAATASAAAAAAAAAAASSSSSGARTPLCVVMEPSRDLAEQTQRCFEAYAKHVVAPPVTSALLVGGLDAGAQLKALKAGADVVVGTPGRLLDFVESGKLQLGRVRFFVLDEADRLVDDNEEAVMKIFRRLPAQGLGGPDAEADPLARLQVLMFSATLHSPGVKRLAAAVCQRPLLVDLKGRDAVPDAVDHVVVRVDPAADASWLQSAPRVFTDNAHRHDDVGPAAAATKECRSEAVKRLKQRLLKRLVDAHRMPQALLFCRTNFDCDNLERFLLGLGSGSDGDGDNNASSASGGGGPAHGGAFRGQRESGREHPYSCVVLAGQRTMEERRRALQAFKDGDVRFLVCTDVAARGIDISGLPFVVNVTLPDRAEDYIHRVGRVGRADCIGLAVSLVATVPEKVWFCTQKGYKPWLDPSKADARTNEQGGHTIWYDEPALLKEVEARLGAPIPPLNDDLSLPAEIAARLADGGGGGGAGGSSLQYGQARGGGGAAGAAAAAAAEAGARMAAIAGSVEALAALEREAQASFLSLKGRWQAGGGGGGVMPMEV